ncbi:glycosyltransferase family 2 protein [Litchfieldella rifensis]|uniref:Glycosyltransferase family 2 protein n=1 Tax=Litchfieldella rifensis TaxID=762643 RepID=A0ABV7LTQ7_9GAMM
MFKEGDPAPYSLEPLCEEEITKNWNDKEVMVSILCPTFQHAGYIEDAIKGFLGQKTGFRYEVIIRDDCSTDGTREIVDRYQKAYPKIIRTIFEAMNRWPTVKALPILLSAAQGKYIAICEGDDYWIDEYKIQKQVRFLEKNDNISLLKTKDLSVEDGVIISPLRAGGTRTFMYPSRIKIPEKFACRCYFGDIFLQAVLRTQGDFYTLNDVTAVWRKHSGGVFGGLIDKDSEFINLQRSQTNFWVAQYLYEQGNPRSARRHVVRSLNNIMDASPNDKKLIMATLYFNCLLSSAKDFMKNMILRSAE